eukprot:COSAG06_NODE_82_length_25183_cov_133.214240_1_plen_220_part_00
MLRVCVGRSATPHCSFKFLSVSPASNEYIDMCSRSTCLPVDTTQGGTPEDDPSGSRPDGPWDRPEPGNLRSPGLSGNATSVAQLYADATSLDSADLWQPRDVNATANGSCPFANNRSCPDHPGPAPPRPPPAPAPPVPPPPAHCGDLMLNTGVEHTPENNTVAASVDECCAQCLALPWCAKWAWHAESTPQLCHKHPTSGKIMPGVRGCYAGIMNRSAL